MKPPRKAGASDRLVGVTFRAPASLRRQLAIALARSGESLQEAGQRWMREYVASDGSEQWERPGADEATVRVYGAEGGTREETP